MSTVIKVENISKQYRLGQVGTGSLAHDVNRFWHRVRGKENPYLKIGEENNRSVKGHSEYVWALKDINFEVKHGEVLGIIGRNGAGKSTLLKILSRTTTPTTGKVKIKGRVASLLEVGTGFHPELSGRENIFLNGAILGMTKSEIKGKFDEIVDFSGVERYIDTPVKRYSSGMYVRLAFAVAASLDPEILIVDEVLAVGDAEFQKKCLHKMKSVSERDGRTILFVSHNLSAIKSLCTRGILFDKGKLSIDTTVEKSISFYFASQLSFKSLDYKREGNKKVEIQTFELHDTLSIQRKTFLMGEDLHLKLSLKFNQDVEDVEIGINVKDNNHDLIFHLCNYDDNLTLGGIKGDVKLLSIIIPSIHLTPGNYILDLGLVVGEEKLDILEGVTDFFVTQGSIVKRKTNYPSHTRYYSNSYWQLKSHTNA